MIDFKKAVARGRKWVSGSLWVAMLQSLYVSTVPPDEKFILKYRRAARGKTEWTLSQERAFVEDLVNKRLSAFLAVFGAVLAGVIATKTAPGFQVLVSWVGWAICARLAQATRRAQVKFDVIMGGLKQCPRHPIRWTEGAMEDAGINLKSQTARHHVGATVPVMCCQILLGLFLLSCVNLCVSWPPKDPVAFLLHGIIVK